MVPEIPELGIFGNLVCGPYPLEWNLNGGWAYGVDRHVVPPCLRRSGYAQAGLQFPPPSIYPLCLRRALKWGRGFI